MPQDILFANQTAASDAIDFDVSLLDIGGLSTPKTPSIDRVNQEYARYERERIQSLIIKHGNNKTLVAQELGVSRRTLYHKLKNL